MPFRDIERAVELKKERKDATARKRHSLRRVTSGAAAREEKWQFNLHANDGNFLPATM